MSKPKGWANPAHPMHKPAGGGVARGYSWEPFKSGHTKSLKYGAFSPRTFQPIAQAILEAALESTPYLADPSYRPAVEAWVVAEAKCLLIEDWLDKNGNLDADGNPRPALDQLRWWGKRASDERDRLGLSPLSRARLGRDVTATQLDVAQLFAKLAADEAADAEAGVVGQQDDHDVDEDEHQVGDDDDG